MSIDYAAQPNPQAVNKLDKYISALIGSVMSTVVYILSGAWIGKLILMGVSWQPVQILGSDDVQKAWQEQAWFSLKDVLSQQSYSLGIAVTVFLAVLLFTLATWRLRGFLAAVGSAFAATFVIAALMASAFLVYGYNYFDQKFKISRNVSAEYVQLSFANREDIQWRLQVEPGMGITFTESKREDSVSGFHSRQYLTLRRLIEAVKPDQPAQICSSLANKNLESLLAGLLANRDPFSECKEEDALRMASDSGAVMLSLVTAFLLDERKSSHINKRGLLRKHLGQSLKGRSYATSSILARAWKQSGPANDPGGFISMSLQALLEKPRWDDEDWKTLERLVPPLEEKAQNLLEAAKDHDYGRLKDWHQLVDFQTREQAVLEAIASSVKGSLGQRDLQATKIVALLLDADARIECRDNSENTPLILAADKGYTELVRELIRRGANRYAENADGQTALMRAAFGSHETLRALLDGYAKSELDRKSKSGNTALMEASSHGCTDCVALLLEKGAGVQLRNRWNQDAVSLADDSATQLQLLAKMANLHIFFTKQEADRFSLYGKAIGSNEQLLARGLASPQITAAVCGNGAMVVIYRHRNRRLSYLEVKGDEQRSNEIRRFKFHEKAAPTAFCTWNSTIHLFGVDGNKRLIKLSGRLGGADIEWEREELAANLQSQSPLQASGRSAYDYLLLYSDADGYPDLIENGDPFIPFGTERATPKGAVSCVPESSDLFLAVKGNALQYLLRTSNGRELKQNFEFQQDWPFAAACWEEHGKAAVYISDRRGPGNDKRLMLIYWNGESYSDPIDLGEFEATSLALVATPLPAREDGM